MSTLIRSAAVLLLAFTTVACGGPATPPPAPAAAPPAKPASSPLADPKGTIDAARTAAGAANASTAARQTAAGGGSLIKPSPQDVAAAAAPALTPNTPKYDAGGRRDPFESLESRLGSDRSTVASAKLTGVIRDGATALALVETSDGIGYILKAGDTLADGRLLEISANSVVFSVVPKPGSTTNRVVLRLASD